jgi:glutamate formiminotransferase
MNECVALAHRFGREVAAKHKVPVYFYANAALRPDRVKLGDIRNKVQYEGLAEALATTHVPDAGSAAFNDRAGGVVVGARPFLIAFNIELDTTDLKLAKRIAKEIRESSGGLPAVQALGFELKDPQRVQVSMNLLDFRTTSLARVWREVETRATDAGVKILRGELIGLVPLDAALQVTADALKLDGFDRTRVIEARFLE